MFDTELEKQITEEINERVVNVCFNHTRQCIHFEITKEQIQLYKSMLELVFRKE